MFIQPLILNPHGNQAMFTSLKENTVRAVDEIEQSLRNRRIQPDPSSKHNLYEPSQTSVIHSTQPPDVVDISTEALVAADRIEVGAAVSAEMTRPAADRQADTIMPHVDSPPIFNADSSSAELQDEPQTSIRAYKTCEAEPNPHRQINTIV